MMTTNEQGVICWDGEPLTCQRCRERPAVAYVHVPVPWRYVGYMERAWCQPCVDAVYPASAGRYGNA